LGREQIADCPTAISELWKNSYDAYSRSVELNIFTASEGGLPVAALVDDGHGMSKEEFIDKWLVVGTESKALRNETLESDKNGLTTRPRQGQKGIGRLSCAAMGSLLLLVSKREAKPFVASLIDWRIFENPYLILNDIELPVIEFNFKDELLGYLPKMFDALMCNIWGTNDEKDIERNIRIQTAWKAYDSFEESIHRSSTRSDIENTIIGSSFEPKHFEKWSVWNDKSNHGTALFISQISDDLLSQLSSESANNDDSANSASRSKFFETLSGFIDPYIKKDDPFVVSDFTAQVNVWHGNLMRVVLDKTSEFNAKDLDQLEHFVEGVVDETGTFKGTLRVFGKDFSDIVIPPREPLSRSSNSLVGPFLIRFGTFELQPSNTTHTEEQHIRLKEAAQKYAGFMLHRDGFRIMPYGREDNDYFEIEKRRSYNAGDYFWSSRRTFGGIKISREKNPNLRDKAGREGIIDNKAAKQFKRVVINILEDIGRKHFGRNSDNRKEMLPKIEAEKERARAEEARKKQITKERRDLRKRIAENSDRLIAVSRKLELLVDQLTQEEKLKTKELAIEFQEKLSELSSVVKDLDLGAGIISLGSLEDEFKEYKKQHHRISALQNQASVSLNIVLEKLFAELPEQIFKDERARKVTQIQKRIMSWQTDARHHLAEESIRLEELSKNRIAAFLGATEGIYSQIADNKIQLASGLNLLEQTYNSHSRENEEIFPPYIGALQSLRDQIDLQGLISFSIKESDALREEIGRIHALAQLGITVEVIGHEIEGLDMTIERGLKEMPDSIKDSDSYKNVLAAHHALSDKWRFLSPLKLSGEKIYRNITGEDIERYVLSFFDDYIDKDRLEITFTQAFKSFKLKELPSRIYPVFVNLFNNSRYWVRHTKESKPKILFDYINGKIIVADNGPGVDEDDLSQLFSLFFTKKASGGRGVGLYLCRASLAAGGHTIKYETESNKKLLAGANFVLEFKGASNE